MDFAIEKLAFFRCVSVCACVKFQTVVIRRFGQNFKGYEAVLIVCGKYALE
jgi:hypothetical protein